MFYKDPNEFKESGGYNLNGQWFPRVTKILEIKAKPALYKFYGEVKSFKHGEEIKQKSADEGTLIHETIENIMLGKKEPIDESVRPAVEAFMEFAKEKKIRVAPELVERRIAHPLHRYAGTIDAVALIDGRYGVLDIKTSQSIYRDYNLQTAAYMEALKTEPVGGKLETRWILRIDQNKTCKTCGATLRQKGGRDKVRTARTSGSPCPEEEHNWEETKGVIELKEFPFWKDDFDAFLAAKKLWEWENEYMLKQVGYL